MSKKIISFLLIIATLLSISVTSFAAEGNAAAPDAAATQETAADSALVSIAKKIRGRIDEKKAQKEAAKAQETTTAAPATEKATKASSKSKKEATTAAPATEATTKKKSIFSREKVANLYLLVSNANPDMPHVWVYIENLTNRTFTVGHYTLGPNETMSAGCWKDRGNGDGIYYNLERYWVKEATYDRTYYLKTSVTERELNRVSKTFNRHNYWNWVFNCTWFGTCVWNTVDMRQMSYLFSSKILRVQMKMFGAKKLDVQIKKLTNSKKCYKHTDKGITVVYPGVVYTSTGV